MANLDLRKARQNGEKRFCPLMGEWCTKGWTPKMGTKDDFPIEGACAAWQPIPIVDLGEPVNIHGCVQFDWKADLMIALDASVAGTRASVDKVANVTAEQTSVLFAAMSPEIQQRVAQAKPTLIEQNNGNP